MKNIDIKEIILIVVIIILGIFISLNLFKDNKVVFITDNNNLYDKTIKYLLKQDNNKDKTKKNYKRFIDYKGFGIAQDKKYKYAYMWLISDSYYEKNNKLIKSAGYSTPCKVIFNKENDKLIKVVFPKDGVLYKASIINMFPKSVQKKVLSYVVNDSNLKKTVDEYYNTMNNNKIYKKEK